MAIKGNKYTQTQHKHTQRSHCINIFIVHFDFYRMWARTRAPSLAEPSWGGIKIGKKFSCDREPESEKEKGSWGRSAQAQALKSAFQFEFSHLSSSSPPPRATLDDERKYQQNCFPFLFPAIQCRVAHVASAVSDSERFTVFIHVQVEVFFYFCRQIEWSIYAAIFYYVDGMKMKFVQRIKNKRLFCQRNGQTTSDCPIPCRYPYGCHFVRNSAHSPHSQSNDAKWFIQFFPVRTRCVFVSSGRSVIFVYVLFLYLCWRLTPSIKHPGNQ